jgi:hypothetical protein
MKSLQSLIRLVTWLVCLSGIGPLATFADPPTTTGQPVTTAGNQTITGTKDFTALQVNGVTQFHTPQDYGAIADGSTHPLNVAYGSMPVYSTTAAAQAAFPITISGCTFSSAATTVTCTDATFLSAGMPVSGAGIASGTTVSSVTDSTHFVISAATTLAQTSIALTSSFVTDKTQERDWIALQQCIWVNGTTYLPLGVYYVGTTVKVKSPFHPQGVVIFGAGFETDILAAGNIDAIQVMQGHTMLRDLAINTTLGSGSQGNGIVLNTNASEASPPNYTWNFHFDHVYVEGFANGAYNPYKWDEGSIARCSFYHCGAGVKTVGNLDTLKIISSSSSALYVNTSLTITNTTAGSPVVSVVSAANLCPGMQITGTVFGADNVSIVSISGTQLTLSENASSSVTSGSLVAQTTALWVDLDGRANWDGNVLNAGCPLYSSSNAGCVIEGNHLHLEGISYAYAHIGANGRGRLDNSFLADASPTYLAYVSTAAAFYLDAVTGPASSAQTFSADHNDIRAWNCPVPITVNVFNNYTYSAGPWHTAEPYESAGSPFWPAASQSADGTIIAQPPNPSVGGDTSKLWQCKKTPGGTWAYQLINGTSTPIAGVLQLTEQAAPGSPVDGMIYKDSTTHHVNVYDGNSSSWKQLDN